VSGPMLASYVALWVLVGVLSVALFALYHHFGKIYIGSAEGRQRQGPDRGEELKTLDTVALFGRRVHVPNGRPTLLLFASIACPLCRELLPDLEELARARRDLDTVVICGGEPDKVATWADGAELTLPIVPDATSKISTRYGIGITPFMVAVARDGVVREKGLVNEREGLELFAKALVSRSTAEAEDEHVAAVGNGSAQSA
jgi:methylamine dehydrogenase accessory protein MauD